jgi:hypothetical protein
MTLSAEYSQNNSNFDDRCRYWILFLDRTVAKRILNFQSRIGRNFGSHEYCISRDLAQLSDGLLNGSKWLAICELRQSETRPVAESAFLADCTFLYKSSFWQDFAMTSPETSYTKKLDIRFGPYGNLKSGFSSAQILDRLGIRCFIRFLGHKMSATRWRLNTSSEGNQLSFPRLLKQMFSITSAMVTAV